MKGLKYTLFLSKHKHQLVVYKYFMLGNLDYLSVPIIQKQACKLRWKSCTGGTFIYKGQQVAFSK